jgi:2-polyprenyl-6-methoxyphenol hydroxylase-like FAD-dependent oxidoreductase
LALAWADSPTFVVNFLTPAWDRALRVLHDERAFMAVLPHLPPVAPWVDARYARPINRVESMGALRNTVRRFIVDAEPVALGFHAVGDALCHTNPALGFGASLALTHAFALADVLKAHPHDMVAQACAMDARVWPLAWDCYRAAVEADESRSRAWRGETAGPATEEDWPRFRATVVARAAALDPVVYRAFWRSVQLLDPPSLLRGRCDVLERARRAVAAHPQSPQPPAGPPREAFLAIARAALAGAAAPA